MVPAWASRLMAELDAADLRAEAVAKGLSVVQLNWRPVPGTCSVGQCLEHLRIGNEILVPVLSAALAGHERKTVDDIVLRRPSRWFIRNYIAANPGGTRAKAPKKIAPAAHIEPTVLEALLHSNQAARELIEQASDYDVNRIRYRNPFVPLLRFTVGTGLEIIAKHEGRHLLQAEAVRQSPGFPDR